MLLLGEDVKENSANVVVLTEQENKKRGNDFLNLVAKGTRVH